jgi:hypothetical protein
MLTRTRATAIQRTVTCSATAMGMTGTGVVGYRRSATRSVLLPQRGDLDPGEQR